MEGPGFGEGETGIYVKDITEGGPAQKVHQFHELVLLNYKATTKCVTKLLDF